MGSEMCIRDRQKLMIMKVLSKNILNRSSETFGKSRHVKLHHYFRCHLCFYMLIINLTSQLAEDHQPASMRPKAIDSEAMRVRGIIVLVKSN